MSVDSSQNNRNEPKPAPSKIRPRPRQKTCVAGAQGLLPCISEASPSRSCRVWVEATLRQLFSIRWDRCSCPDATSLSQAEPSGLSAVQRGGIIGSAAFCITGDSQG